MSEEKIRPPRGGKALVKAILKKPVIKSKNNALVYWIIAGALLLSVILITSMIGIVVVDGQSLNDVVLQITIT